MDLCYDFIPPPPPPHTHTHIDTHRNVTKLLCPYMYLPMAKPSRQCYWTFSALYNSPGGLALHVPLLRDIWHLWRCLMRDDNEWGLFWGWWWQVQMPTISTSFIMPYSTYNPSLTVGKNEKRATFRSIEIKQHWEIICDIQSKNNAATIYLPTYLPTNLHKHTHTHILL